MKTKATGDRRAAVWTPLLIICAAVVANLNVLDAGFVWDDGTLIVNNTLIRHWHTLPSLFTRTFLATYYRPVVIFSFALEYALWGAYPVGFHATNLMLHSLNAVLAFVIFRRVTRNANAALFGALLFAVHPAHKGVVYIADRTGMLATSFFLASIILYIGCREAKNRAGTAARYIAALAAFVMALFSKEEALMLPVVILFADVFMGGERDKRNRLVDIGLTGPFFMSAILYVFIRGNVIGSATGLLEGFRIEPMRRLLTVPGILLRYLFLLVYPSDMDFNGQTALASSTLDIKAWAALCTLVLLAALIPWLSKRSKPLAFGLLWFLIVFVPMSNIIPIFPDIADRALFTPVHFLYLPSIGMFLCAGYAFTGLVESLRKRASRGFLSRKGALLSFICIVLAFSLLSLKRNTIWENDISLFRYMTVVNPDNAMAHRNLGTAYLSAGNINDAFNELQAALKLDPNNANAYKNLGVALLEMGFSDNAIGAFQRSIALQPDDATAYGDLAVAYVQKGLLREAIAAGEKAVAIDPSSSQARTNTGLIYLRAGMFQAAEKQFLAALDIDAADADTYNALGALYFRLGDYARARAHWEKALRIRPNFEEAQNNLDRLNARTR